MGKITNVLNKIQKSRQSHQDQEIPDTFYVKEGQQAFSMKVGMVIIIVIAIITAGAVGTVFISNEIYDLEKSVKMQEKRFNDLTVFLNNTKSLSDSQVQDFNSRLKDETDGRKIQINKLTLIDNVYYIHLIKSINADTRQINYLDKYIEDLNSKIERISASGNQSKDLPYSPSGN